MSPPHQPRFFDVESRTAKLTEMGAPLVGLNTQNDAVIAGKHAEQVSPVTVCERFHDLRLRGF